MAITEKKFEIKGTRLNLIDGPSKFDLMASLFVKGHGVEKVPVRFVAEGGTEYLAFINGVEMEDGSGESWIIKGYAYGVDPNKRTTDFTGWFRTDAPRKGYMKF